MSELNDLYQEVILDHTRSPHNFGTMANADLQARGNNPLCGDQVTVYIKLKGDVIEDVSFEGSGCAISKSSASLMTDSVKNKSKADVQKLYESFHHLIRGEADQIAHPDELGKLAVFSGVSEFPTRVKCASLAWHTLRSALDSKPTGSISTE